MRYEINNATGCHEWIGPRDKEGYGIARLFGQGVGAHRLSYLLNIGPLTEGDMVLHKCDNPKCINPLHLFKGNAALNARDMANKGRNKPGPATAPGENHSTAKLTDDQVKTIISSKAPGTFLAAEYGVSAATISKIRNGKLWGHLPRGNKRPFLTPEK